MKGIPRRRSARELATRLRQQLAIRLDRAGIGRGVRLPEDGPFLRALGLPQVSTAVESFSARRSVGPFPAMTDPHSVASAILERWPGRVAEVVGRADKILAGRFDLLGFEELSFGDPVDWQLDPVSGRRTPDVHWSRVDPLDASSVGDHKVVWELSRHQYLLVLCRAWLFTGEARYAEEAVLHLDAWMEANPPKVGMNWVSSLELAYRSIAWIWTLGLLEGRHPLPSATFFRALKHLWVSGLHVEAHLSTYFSPNTHLTGEALGLLYLGTFFPFLPDAARWRKVGWDVLTSELDRQVEPDGTYFERATYYHRYTVDIYTHALLLGGSMDAPDGDVGKVREGLSLLMEHLAALTRPDGTLPLFGDDDGGHLWFPEPGRLDVVRPSLINGALVLDRPDLAHAAGWSGPEGGMEAEEALWLLGAPALEALEALEPEPPPFTSRAFPVGGFYTFREGWDPSHHHMVVDAGPHGVMNCGHAHADALAFDLTVGGRPVLVDPGTFSYVDPASRRAFRSAGVHNTATVDGAGASEPGTPFQWERVTGAVAELWRAGAAFDYLGARHSGFASFAPPGIHRRETVFARGSGWLIRDGLEVGQGHLITLTFQLAPGLGLEETDSGCSILGERGTPLLHLFHVRVGHPSQALQFRVEEGWVSNAYGRRDPAHRWTVGVDGGPADVLTLMLPGLGASREDRPEMELDHVPRGSVVRLHHLGRKHLIFANGGKTEEGSGAEAPSSALDWETDARLLWWCRQPRSPEERAFLLDGTRLRLDACWVLPGEERHEVGEWVRTRNEWEKLMGDAS